MFRIRYALTIRYDFQHKSMLRGQKLNCLYSKVSKSFVATRTSSTKATIPQVSKDQRRTPIRSMSYSSERHSLSHHAFIAMGSNLGDRVGYIESALSMMSSKGINVLKCSPLYETKPMYYKDQSAFINGICEIETKLQPLALLDALQAIENSLERKRTISKGPRTIDLDIVLYDQDNIQHERLIVPHKLMHEREFVLRPLADISPSETLKLTPEADVNQRPIREILEGLPDKDVSMSPVTVLGSNVPVIRPKDSTRPTLVMGILNVTPNSFSDGGAHFDMDHQSLRSIIKDYISAGASIIDVGGQSTKPNAEPVSVTEELQRVLPIIKCIREIAESQNIIVSIDTFYSQVAREAIAAGADIVNDVSAGTLDENMLSTVAELGKTIILMHMRGDPHTMTKLTDYPGGVVKDVARELAARVRAAQAAGIQRWRIILDPGIGFAKNQAQNLELLDGLDQLRNDQESYETLAGLPWLVGTSRKKFIGKITGVQEASQRVMGTAAAVTASIAKGADIIRVHDVAEMSQVVKMADAIYRRP